MALLTSAAELGHLPSQKLLALAHARASPPNLPLARAWFRAAAVQGDSEAAFNLVALCDGLPLCVQGEASPLQAEEWLRDAASQGMHEAGFQLGLIEQARGSSEEALTHFLLAARGEHAKASFNAAHLLASRAGASLVNLTAAIGLFGHSARIAHADGLVGVEADVKVALSRLRRLWVQMVDSMSDLSTLSEVFAAAREADAHASLPAEGEAAEAQRGGEGGADEARVGASSSTAEKQCVDGWLRAASLWQDFEAAYAKQPSPQNELALGAMGRAIDAFRPLLHACPPGEYRRHMLLGKLVEGSRLLARDDPSLRRALGWQRALLHSKLCAELFARIETNPSCFNDQLAAAITMHRRLNETVRAEELVAVGRAHPEAATHWISAAQTPRVFDPTLRASPWWSGGDFDVASALEAAWASGTIADDLRRLGIGGEERAGGGRFERIVSTGAPIESLPGEDLVGEGAWSEFMIFDGERWDEDRCALTQALCEVLRAAPEVSGVVQTAGGDKIGPQGQVTVFRLLPGARVLPHVGVTNKRLVLQLPLHGHEGVRVRVDEEWRRYEEGRAMVFDDSFEHEVRR
ncbi:MAG: hypothetical protein SGPRY_006760 [Prymnesium sp.]